MRLDLPEIGCEPLPLLLGVFMKAGRGDTEAFTSACSFITSLGVSGSSAAQEPNPVSLGCTNGTISYEDDWFAPLFSVPDFLCRLRMEGQLGDVGNTTFERSLVPGSRAASGMGMFLPMGTQLPGGLVSVRIKHFRVLPFISRFTLAWWPGLLSFALFIACVIAARSDL